jgi:polysaccharide export outer membrane protein
MHLLALIAVAVQTFAAPQGQPVTARASQGAAARPAQPPAQTAGQTPPAQNAQTPSGYRIGPQDLLLITVVDEPELTGKFPVDSDGMFTYPYLNRVRAAGLTAAEVQAQLGVQLRNGYLRNPQIRVEVELFRSQSVFVIGEVRQAGKIPMTGATMSLLEALVAAGSPTPQASNEIIVRRKNVDGKPGEEIRVNRRDLELGKTDIVLRDGDIINVPQAQRFYVDGYVRNPGFYVLDPGMTVQQAIALAGGLAERGSDRGITASRIVNGKNTTVDVRLEDKVQSNDVIRVRQRFF